MQGILDLMNSDLGKTLVSGVSSSTNQDSSKTKDLLSLAMPVLTKAMQNNASTPEGAKSLMSALESKHNGSILSNLDGLFDGGVDANVKSDGQKILGHILGSKQSNVVEALSKQSGLDSSSASNILETAAPLLMGMIGKETTKANVKDSSQLSSILSGLVAGKSGGTSLKPSLLQSILDADKDGSIVDDVAGILMGNGQKEGLLSKLFKKK